MIRHVAHIVQVKPNFILQVRPLSQVFPANVHSLRYKQSAALNDALRLFYALITIIGIIIPVCNRRANLRFFCLSQEADACECLKKGGVFVIVFMAAKDGLMKSFFKGGGEYT